MDNHTLTLSDGRALEVVTAGTPQSSAVVFHHGTPGAWNTWEDWLPEVESQGGFGIAFSRAGYGLSDRCLGRTIISNSSDTAEILKHFDVNSFVSIGTSGGGPHALADTTLHSNKAAISVAGVGEYGAPDLDFLADMGEEDVLKAIRSSSSITDDFTPKHAFSLPVFVTNKSLEGVLAPADYAFATGTTASQALQAMVDGFKRTASSVGLLSGYQQYSPYQVLTVASMVQIEGDPADYSKVAQVIYNRLHIGMALQLNSTVQYAAHLRGQISLSTAATQINSPYNTYRNAGLPPTPISNPSKDAIAASLHPAAGDWLYFITVKPHDTRFTNSFAEFEGWVILYNKNVRAGLFK